MIVGIIPARLQSTRFDNKLLQPLNGKLIIHHVIEHALQLNFLDKIVLATDTESMELINEVSEYNIEYFISDKEVWCGSQRSYHYYLDNYKAEMYVSIPSDEPLIDPFEINKSWKEFRKHPKEYTMYTFYSEFYSTNRLLDVASCKIVGTDKALYFSRNIIPVTKQDEILPLHYYRKHLGIFVFTNKFMRKYGCHAWNKNDYSLASIESLEQNVFLENNIDVGLIKTNHKAYGVDNPQHISELESIYNTI